MTLRSEHDTWTGSHEENLAMLLARARYSAPQISAPIRRPSVESEFGGMLLAFVLFFGIIALIGKVFY